MFNIGDIVSFIMPDGKQKRVGRICRKQGVYYFVLGQCFMYRRIYKLKAKELKKEDDSNLR